jgi:hypothetical protein
MIGERQPALLEQFIAAQAAEDRRALRQPVPLRPEVAYDPPSDDDDGAYEDPMAAVLRELRFGDVANLCKLTACFARIASLAASQLRQLFMKFLLLLAQLPRRRIERHGGALAGVCGQHFGSRRLLDFLKGGEVDAQAVKRLAVFVEMCPNQDSTGLVSIPPPCTNCSFGRTKSTRSK